MLGFDLTLGDRVLRTAVLEGQSRRLPAVRGQPSEQACIGGGQVRQGGGGGMHLAGLLAATGWHQRIELGQQAACGVVNAGDSGRGRAQGDGQGGCFLFVQQHRQYRRTGPQLVATADPGRGLHRVAQFAQALDVAADAAPVHAHAFGQFGPRPLAAGLQQGDQAQQSMGVPQDGLQFTTHRKEQCHDLTPDHPVPRRPFTLERRRGPARSAGCRLPHAGAGPEGRRQPGPGLPGHQPDGQGAGHRPQRCAGDRTGGDLPVPGRPVPGSGAGTADR
ncbi:hypothetical protein G6F32_013474 [Rhizopus arrhizus]|nr:hypothetical protein G6F32_013474 [Rhizopus arrhizus]